MWTTADSWSFRDDCPSLIGRKKVDWSVFEDGTTIPQALHKRFNDANGGSALARGEKRDVVLAIEGKAYRAKLTNVDRAVPSDTLQIRYDSNSQLQAVLLDRFNTSWTHLKLERARLQGGREGKKVFAVTPSDQAEYMEFRVGDRPFEYRVVLADLGNLAGTCLEAFMKQCDEQLLEYALNCLDPEGFRRWAQASLGIFADSMMPGLLDARSLVASVGRTLRGHYSRCQICGWQEESDPTNVTELHMIDRLAESLSVKPRNLLLVCPTHHRLLHATRARFDGVNGRFVDSLGATLGLQLNSHL